MSSFIEFQAMVLGKLCSIEERITNIETVLGISDEVCSEECIDLSDQNPECQSCENSFKDEISEFHKQLDDIKSFFAEADF